jgi:O-antigen biosynthesis protein
MAKIYSGKSICFIIDNFSDRDSVNNIGLYYDQIAKLLSNNEWSVVILSFDLSGKNISDFSESYFRENKISIYEANTLYRENTISPDDVWKDNWHHAKSHIIDKALNVLCKKHGYQFDFIEFPEKEAGGFIPVRAKYSRIFDATRIIVRLHGPSQWQRETHMLEGISFEDLKLDYMEKYAFENADVQASSSQFLLNWVQSHGWKITGNVSVCPSPVTVLNKFNSQLSRDYTKQNQIVFRGRFVKGKGLNEFIKAMNYLSGLDVTVPKRYKISFLNIEDNLSPGYVRECLPGFEVEFKNLSREESLKFLLEQARLVVVPSGEDSSVDKILECMNLGIPFITSKDEYILELLGAGSYLYESLSCDTSNPRLFGDCILRYLRLNIKQQDELLESACLRLESISSPEKIVSWYNNILTEAKSGNPQKRLANLPPHNKAMATIIIPYFNAQIYIKSTLEAIHQQTYNNFKIICVNDGSTDQDAISMLDYIRHQYPDVLILDKENGGVGSALNYGLGHVKTKYVVEVDADDIIKANMIETYVKHMESRPDLAALSCYVQMFQDSNEKEVMDCLSSSKEYISGLYYKPMGSNLPVLFFENCAGCAISIFSSEIIKKIGGWPEKREGVQDWGIWIKLAINGCKMDIVPEVLYYYRNHPTSDMKTKTLWGMDEANSDLIRFFIEKKPGSFYSSSYEGLHRCIRGMQSQIQTEIKNTQIKDVRILNLENQIKQMENQVHQMDYSVGMQLIQKYQHIANKLLPVGTRRGILYGFGLRIVRVILKEGLRGFTRKAFRHIKSRK